MTLNTYIISILIQIIVFTIIVLIHSNNYIKKIEETEKDNSNLLIQIQKLKGQIEYKDIESKLTDREFSYTLDEAEHYRKKFQELQKQNESLKFKLEQIERKKENK